MENQKNDNLNLLEAVVQNTEMGKNTLEQIVPMTEDAPFKAELLRERNIYRQLNQEAAVLQQDTRFRGRNPAQSGAAGGSRLNFPLYSGPLKRYNRQYKIPSSVRRGKSTT